jgi:hypothetical protein
MCVTLLVWIVLGIVQVAHDKSYAINPLPTKPIKSYDPSQPESARTQRKQWSLQGPNPLARSHVTLK